MSARPNFLLIGAARSSTTAVARALAGRPDVFLTEPKEPHFFAFAGERPHFAGPGDDATFNRVAVTDAEDYARLYRHTTDESIRGDASVSTMYYADKSVVNIARYADPEVKIVCLLREPAARALSAHRYLRAKGFERTADFSAALAQEAQRAANGYHHLWHYRGMSRYSRQLPQFLEAFPGRVFIAVSEEIRSDPDGFSTDLCQFLGIAADTPLDLTDEVNSGGEPRSERGARLLGTMRSSPIASLVAKKVLSPSTLERVNQLTRRQKPASWPSLALLREEFANETAFVESLLGRAIPAWRMEDSE